jgi:hypothetical protein
MNDIHWRLCLLMLTAGCVAALGCTDRPQGVDVWGEITFDGKPVPVGRIFFNPDFSKGNDGRQGFAAIRDGKFDTRQGGGPACGGATTVVIEGFDRGSNDTLGNPLFKDYRVAIDLPREPSQRDFAVPASAAKGLPKTRPGRKP